MLNVFVSWSGDRSHRLAVAVAKWLEHVLQPARPWISEEIPKGKRWSDVIGRKLADYNVGIICVTPENRFAPWISFEAGALSKTLDDSRVCPILLGMEPGDLSGPLQQYQCTTLTRKDMLRLVLSLNDLLGDEKVRRAVVVNAFDKYWSVLDDTIRELSAIVMPDDAAAVRSVIGALVSGGMPEPSPGSEAHFSSGFERHALYDVLTSLAQRRLWVFGRKNRKLFDKDHWSFLKSLPGRITDGFDFKVLFLSPEAEEHTLKCAHRVPDFCDELRASMRWAVSVMQRYSIPVDDCCRAYKLCRSIAIMIADDAVVHAPVYFDETGHAKAMTGCAFSVLSCNSPYGRELEETFRSAWQGAEDARPVSRLAM
ncbi:MAG TPA: TIR domain-containing protein [Acidobacteriota bacterium]|nr:TIR domain-containing protein [Acidobacteriota bacterium]